MKESVTCSTCAVEYYSALEKAVGNRKRNFLEIGGDLGKGDVEGRGGAGEVEEIRCDTSMFQCHMLDAYIMDCKHTLTEKKEKGESGPHYDLRTLQDSHKISNTTGPQRHPSHRDRK